ncbi:MAG TPA: TVP38/TMEM64 family protein, partial [archaeon]|nr:TVP38/TMEM64 family protein [archaeon]
MGKLLSKFAVLALVLGTLIAFHQLELAQYFQFDYLKARQAEFQSYYAENQSPVTGAFLLIYIVSTALSLPGALILTLAGGVIFGLWTGLLLVSFASTIGATLAAAVARFLLCDWVQKKFCDRLRPVNEGV